MEERSEADKLDEVMLPGFRFHPTDEELVGFYLKRKVQQQPLSIELIKQLDIYKYDPWDLPKLATTGEKEWYFYCPRDRKYRNSTRPNRVTGAGFWKATGTDRPIYSSEGTKCIGLKKSLVFYKGRAAKGVKTDWMMHEFRLPSLSDAAPTRRLTDKNIPAIDSWAICRIFKKTNSTAQRAASHSWVSPSTPDILAKGCHLSQMLSSDNAAMATKPNSATLPFPSNCGHVQHSSIANIFPLDFASYKSLTQIEGKPSELAIPKYQPLACGSSSSFTFSPADASEPAKSAVDASSLLLNMSSSVLGTFFDANSDDSMDRRAWQMKEHIGSHEDLVSFEHQHADELMHADEQPSGYPFSLPLFWDSLPCTTEVSTSLATAKCYT